MRLTLQHSAVRFGIVGIANTALGLIVIFLAKWIGGLGDVVANIIGYGTGLIVSFWINRQWTFGDTGPAQGAFLRFIAVVAVSYLLNLVTVLLAIRIGANSYAAQAMGIIPYTAFSYLASKYLVFNAHRNCAAIHAASPREGDARILEQDANQTP